MEDLRDRVNHLEETREAAQKEATQLAQALEEAELVKEDLMKRLMKSDTSRESTQMELVRLRQDFQNKQESFSRLQMESSVDTEELDRLQVELDQNAQVSTNLEQQLRIAQNIQGEQTKELRALREEVGRLTEKLTAAESRRDEALAMLDERDARVAQIQGDWTDVRRQLSDVQTKLQRADLNAQEKEQLLMVENQEYKSRLERLRQEFESLQDQYRVSTQQQTLSEEERIAFERLQTDLQEERSQVSTLKTALEQQQEKLEQVAQRGYLTRPIDSSEPQTDETAYKGVYSVQIRRISESEDFVFFTMEGAVGVEVGSSMLLSVGDHMMAEVELADIDASGLVMGYITRKLTDPFLLHTGDFLLGRPLIKTSSDDAGR
jgi:chromosome segregation ATPase